MPRSRSRSPRRDSSLRGGTYRDRDVIEKRERGRKEMDRRSERDDKYDRENGKTKEERDSKDSRDSRGERDDRDSRKETRDSREGKDDRDSRKERDTRDSREERDSRKERDTRDSRVGRDDRDSRVKRDTRDSREEKDDRDSRVKRDTRDSREEKDDIDSRKERDTRDSREGRDDRDSRVKRDDRDSREEKDDSIRERDTRDSREERDGFRGRGEKERERDGERDRGSSKRDREKALKLESSDTETDSSDEERERYRRKSEKPKHVDEYGRAIHTASPPPAPPTKEELALMKASKEERRKAKIEAKKQKELAKHLETPEEKRARRLAKREAKQIKERKKLGWDDDYMGYTNNDNPFGDQHLLEKFVWSKKTEKEMEKLSVSEAEVARIEATRQEENRRELAKVKERRKQREMELEEMEKQREVEAREKETKNMASWEEKEEKFHLEQARMRSTIRIQQGRAKPIDMLVKYISTDIDSPDIDIDEPYLAFDGLSVLDLEDLLADVNVHIELGRNVEYWQDLKVICEHELEQQRRKVVLGNKTMSANVRGAYESGLNDAVAGEVKAMFSSKTYQELKDVEAQIQAKLQGGQAVDVTYWESLLVQLTVHVAKARLADMHQRVLRRKLELLQEQGMDMSAPPDQEEVERGDVVFDEADLLGTEVAAVDKDKKEVEAVGEEYEDMYSPRYTSVDSDDDLPFVDVEEDLAKLEHDREMILANRIQKRPESIIKEAEPGDEDHLVGREKEKGMDEDEEEFSLEVNLNKEAYLWSDKYRPRKPRFFNRVHTGFEWHKYNQTHYDKDNPPPKIVQGYKFNIFYPDLIDKSKSPTYTLIAIPKEPEFCIVRFQAGPPYE
eukprot:Ihof_evm13s24 gene=Ihof_evmTU13s24